MDELLIKVVRLAAKVHKGQVDRFGKPFITHVLRVVTSGRDMDEQVLGALHDVLERSELTVADLREKGFPEHVLEALQHISRLETEDYDKYIDRVCKNSLAVRVKVHDLADKMDLRNVGLLNEADLKRYNKQMAAFARLRRLESIVRAELVMQAKPEQVAAKGAAKSK